MADTLILYHANCIDGFAAAFACWLHFNDTADYIPVNYGQEPPDVTGKDVFIVDFSYPRNVLLEMKSKANLLVVLDHHKTAEKELEGLDYCYFDMEKSGCMMAFDYWFWNEEPPNLFKYIQDRDLWKFEYPESKPLHAVLSTIYPSNFNDWAKLFDEDFLFETINRGNDILAIFNKEIEGYIHQNHPVILNGIPGLACNLPPKYASEMGHQLVLKSDTFGLTYWYSGTEKKWLCSIRSNGKIDVSEIAKKYGGGGHRNASGFALNELIF